ncbi:MAG: hypothetical protein HKO56_06390, partial [Bacteroidia bacterium]|nr:hypothetical protein [Bacteroidia bacterium]
SPPLNATKVRINISEAWSEDNGILFDNVSFCVSTPCQPCDVTCATTVIQDVSCNGGTDGQASVMGSGGTTPYSYNWGTADPNALSAGTYTVTVTDSNNCSSTCDVTITEPDLLDLDLGPDRYLCLGDTIILNTLINGNPPCDFHGATITQVLGNVDNPEYTLDFSDWQGSYFHEISNGEYTRIVWNFGNTYSAGSQICFKAKSENVGINSQLTLWRLTSGVPETGTYEAIANFTFDNLDYKDYCFILPDDMQFVKLTDDSGDPFFIDAVAVDCDNNGILKYEWSTGENSDTIIISPSVANQYNLTVTYNDICTVSDSLNVIVSNISLTTSLISNVSCSGFSDGSATVTATGGIPPYSYLWSNGEISSIASNLSAGLNFITVTDSISCIVIDSILITEPDPISCSTSVIQHVSCFGGNDGQASVVGFGGTSPYSYNWGSADPNALIAGTYTVTVTDSNDCTNTCDVTINEPSAVVSCSVVEDSPVVCSGESNGVATVTPNGGNGGFTYLWDNSETTQQAIALDAGVHSVTVTDSKGCTSSCSVTINEPSLDAVSCSVVEDSPVVCYGESNGVATITPAGGIGGYTYLWDNAETTQQATTLDAGLHFVTVTDSQGCTSSCSVTINEPSDIVSCFIVEDSPVVCNGESNGVATVTPNGGNGGFTYLWDNSETTQQATALDAGVHTVTVTDFKGCTSSCSVTINEPSA